MQETHVPTTYTIARHFLFLLPYYSTLLTRFYTITVLFANILYWCYSLYIACITAYPAVEELETHTTPLHAVLRHELYTLSRTLNNELFIISSKVLISETFRLYPPQDSNVGSDIGQERSDDC
jgi:hypothetical protein